MIKTLEGTERYLVTRRIVPEGMAHLYDNLPKQLKETISEVHYVDGSKPVNKGLQGTYGIDLNKEWAERIERTATNLIDLINISRHGQGYHPEDDMDAVVSENSLEKFIEENLEPSTAPAPRRWIPGVTLDQGREGSCVGHGCRHHVNGEPVMTDPRSGPTAVEIYNWAQKNDPWPGEDYEGTSVKAGLDALVHFGYVKSVGFTRSIEAFLQWLSDQGGLIIGSDWFEGMHRTNAQGFITPTGQLTGGHCVWINELLLTLDGVGGQNSWGASWGINGGFFKLSLEHLRYLMSRSGFVAGAVTQVGAVTPPEPKPSKLPEIYVTKVDNLSTQEIQNGHRMVINRAGQQLAELKGVKVK